MSFDLFLSIGGYWSSDDVYLGGEAHESGRHVGEGFSLDMVRMRTTVYHGYQENMRKVSWFPPETLEKKVDIEDDAELGKAVQYAPGSGALSLFIVREDDPYAVKKRRDIKYEKSDSVRVIAICSDKACP
ncbi:unnamed protein product [Arabis nemorensis]|uniref:Uncharacterized protein n=1 Tax=Arabis nemorensis TaxID=586526 RepID=A0A565BBC7_9BRAS|nr:unnamed protein product [Arabis nemorensis]